MRRRQAYIERNYLECIFDNHDYESPEEKAIRSAESIPSTELMNSIERKKYEKI